MKQHTKCGLITHSAKERGQQKEQYGWGLEIQGIGGRGMVVGQNLKKWGIVKIEGLYKIGGLVTLCQLCKET